MSHGITPQLPNGTAADPVFVQNVGGGSAVSIADGADVAEGSTTDAATLGDVNGSVTSKLRGLSKIFNDVWDSVNHVLGVKLLASQVVTLTPPAAITNYAKETGGNLDTLVLDNGVQGTGLNPPTGGSGIIGFLSGIFNQLITSITVNQGAANATPWNQNISTFGGSAVAIGQNTKSASLPVTLASDQGAIPVNAAFSGNLSPAQSIQNVSPLATLDQATTEGQGNGELLIQILTELKIISHYLYNSPHGAVYYPSDEPAVLRNDTSFTST